MFTTNVVGGDYVMPVPTGAQITLMYDEKGLLVEVMSGTHESCAKDKMWTNDQLLDLVKECEVPTKIRQVGATTFVQGVITSHTPLPISIAYGYMLQNDYIKLFHAFKVKFNFFGYNIIHNGKGLINSMSANQQLKALGFNPLEGFLAQQDINDEVFAKCADRLHTANFPWIMLVGVWHMGKLTFNEVPFTQLLVRSVTQIYDNNDGAVLARLHLNESDLLSVHLNYGDVVKWNIHRNTLILINNKTVYAAIQLDNIDREPRSKQIICKHCGSVINVNTHGNTYCPAPYCISTCNPRIVQFLKALKLPTDYDDDKFAMQSTDGTYSICDILELLNVDHVDVTLLNLVRGIVPESILPSINSINNLLRLMQYSPSAFQHYVACPDRMASELGLDMSVYRKFIDWINVPENSLNIYDAMHNPRINILDHTKAFDGPPIFRGKKIYLTGGFMHGSHQEITQILKSYSAEVINEFSEDANLVLIGDLNTDISGYAIQRAKRLGTPIMFEFDFFNQYDIDEDIKSNLQFN